MADVINKKTKIIYRSVNTPDYPEPEFMIINGKTLPTCEIKYWKIVDDEVVEMSIKEKAVVDYVVPPLEPTAEELALHAENEHRQNIKTEIEKVYPYLSDQLQEIQMILVEEFPNNVRVQEYNAIIEAAKAKYPKA